ncbi:MAG TPA: GGDEF domain-containing protein [Burkholderiales bacterium]|nr:GGDEF domain-containing protein [Burkholderiales bacterium]
MARLRLLECLPEPLVLGVAAIALAGVFLGDLATGAELSLAPLYLLIVLAVSWLARPAAAWWFAALAAGALVAVGAIEGHPYSREIYFYADVASKLFGMVVTVLLAARLRRAYDRERASARSDALTGLANRAGFLEALDLELTRLARHRRPLALAYIDCDGFKRVNDVQGHGAGDALLRAAATTLAAGIRRTDRAARIGGDEYALLLPETDASACRIVLEQLRGRLRAAMDAYGWPVTFSVGAAVFTRPGTTAARALTAADELMYRVKARGKNGLLIRTDGDAAESDRSRAPPARLQLVE